MGYLFIISAMLLSAIVGIIENIFFKNDEEKMKIIGISGKMNSGKDTVARIIQWMISIDRLIKEDNPKIIINQLKKQGHCDFYDYTYMSRYERVAFSDSLRRRLSITFEITEEALRERKIKNNSSPIKDFTWRELMQKEGKAMRDLNENYWVDSLFKNYDRKFNWIITDVRYPNEVKKIKEEGGIIIRVDRDLKNKKNTEKNVDDSETALDKYTDWDYLIKNNSSQIENLEKSVMRILIDLKLISEDIFKNT